MKLKSLAVVPILAMVMLAVFVTPARALELPTIDAFTVDANAQINVGGTSARITGTITCSSDWLVRITVRLQQSHASSFGAAMILCNETSQVWEVTVFVIGNQIIGSGAADYNITARVVGGLSSANQVGQVTLQSTPVSISQFSVDGTGQLNSTSTQAQLSGKITCTDGARVTIEITLTSGGVTGEGRRSVSCTGSEQEWQATVRAPRGDVFTAGSASYSATATPSPTGSPDSESGNVTLQSEGP